MKLHVAVQANGFHLHLSLTILNDRMKNVATTEVVDPIELM